MTMTTEQKIIADLAFYVDKPTSFSFAVLHRWVIWQFPRPHQDGMIGAVHPPTSEHPWYPAIVKAKSEEVLIHAHVEAGYESPETAVSYFD